VIGHEISHGFDDQGAKYDATGELKNWWTPADYKEFQSRGQCVVNQFSAYTVDGGLHENGKLVLGESIGDLGGVKLAYLAFQKSMQGKPRPSDQDGFTPEQQFFISWGQARGDEIRPDFQRQMVLTNPHPSANIASLVHFVICLNSRRRLVARPVMLWCVRLNSNVSSGEPFPRQNSQNLIISSKFTFSDGGTAGVRY
jgi:predicted metalloendopeptidase